MTVENKEDSKNFHQWIELGTLITFLVALLYTAGWSYAYHYFDHFHLGLIKLGIPREYFLLYSFWVIKRFSFYFIVGILFLASLYLFLRYYLFKTIKEKGYSGTICISLKKLAIFLIPILIIIFFWASYYLGGCTAKMVYRDQVQKDFPSYPRIKVWIKSHENQQSNEKAIEWEKGCYRLLLETKDNLYIFYPAYEQDKIPTDSIPLHTIEYFRILPVYRSCIEK